MRALGAFLGVLILVAAITAVVRTDRSDSKTATIPLPDRTYSAAVFDTVVWESEEAAMARGKDVFGWVCTKCHGLYGRGDGGEVIDGDTLHPPSFVTPEWRFASSEQALWERIYLGNNRGMPHWGEQGLQARDIVAVSAYILKELRKETK